MGSRRTALAAAIAIVSFAGCGPTDNAELKRRIQALDAIAVEGGLLADGVAGDRTKATFARVHARTLSEAAQHEAEKLADADVLGDLRRERTRAVAIATRVAGALSTLQTFPGGERTAREVRGELAAAADAAQRLDGAIPERR